MFVVNEFGDCKNVDDYYGYEIVYLGCLGFM